MITGIYKMHSVTPRGKAPLPIERFDALPVPADGKWRARLPGAKSNSLQRGDVVRVDTLDELEKLACMGYGLRMVGQVSGNQSILKPEGRKVET